MSIFFDTKKLKSDKQSGHNSLVNCDNFAAIKNNAIVTNTW